LFNDKSTNIQRTSRTMDKSIVSPFLTHGVYSVGLRLRSDHITFFLSPAIPISANSAIYVLIPWF